jgi:hypothetical protein
MRANFFELLVAAIIFFAVIFLNIARCEIFGGVQSCAEFMQGLADRGLFESAEFLYLNESKKADLNNKEKYTLTTSIVYARMLQILTTTGSTRSKLCRRLATFESEFQNNIKKSQSNQQTTNTLSAENLELIRLQFQFAVAWYLIGGRMQFESEVANENDAAKLNADAQKLLLTATEQLKKINSYLAPQQNPTLSDQINLLSDNINLYVYLSEISYILTIPASDIRNDKLNRLIFSFDSWSRDKLKFYSGKLNLSESKLLRSQTPQVVLDSYYLSIHACVEVSACYRIIGELEKAFEVLSIHALGFNDVRLPDELRLRLAAERIRFLAASANNVTINNRIAVDTNNTNNTNKTNNTNITNRTDKLNNSNWDVNELLRFRVNLSMDSLEYCLAKLEWGIFLAGRLKESGAAAELMVVSDILKLVRQMEAKIPSCGYCAAVVIGANKNVQTATATNSATATSNSRLSAIRTMILCELAQDQRERNRIEEAANLFELAGRVSASAGNIEEAMKNIQYSASLLYELLNRLEIAKQKTAQDPKLDDGVELELSLAIWGYRDRVMRLLCGMRSEERRVGK